MARNFQMLRRLDRPSISRRYFRLRVGAMVNWGEGVGQDVDKGKGSSQARYNDDLSLSCIRD